MTTKNAPFGHVAGYVPETSAAHAARGRVRRGRARRRVARAAAVRQRRPVVHPAALGTAAERKQTGLVSLI